MATASLSDYKPTGSWADLVATIAAAASVDVVIQNVGNNEIQVVFGGASAPTGKSGIILWQGDSVQGNAANIWLRAENGFGIVSVATV